MAQINKQDNLFKALGLFIEAMRSYVVSKLMAKAGDQWPSLYYETLTTAQKEGWDFAVKKDTKPENLIDFHNLKGFALHYKDLLKSDFHRAINKLPTWLEDIADVRHNCTHYHELDDSECQRAYANIISIARNLKMTELEEAVIALRDNKIPRPKETGDYPAGLHPWFKNVTPHIDIRQGLLDESVFAANLAEVALGSSREVYRNPAMFFSKTYLTGGLKTLTRRVIQGLNGKQEAENRVITLQTGFGGGKTHALILLYHIANIGKKVFKYESSKYILENSGTPEFDAVKIAVFTNKTNDPTQGRQVNDIHIRTIWGELAFQLGGKDAYDRIRPNDQNQTAPKGLFKQILQESTPALILIDELADYCVAAAGVPVGATSLSDQTISFIQELSEAVSAVDHCVMVVTLPASASEVANSPYSSQILTSLSNRLGRVSADTKPVSDEEIFEVIRRRLFEHLGSEEIIEDVISTYMDQYQQLSAEMPDFAARSEYREKLRKSYPFHPELIDMFRIRWASHHDFQRTRGVLRLLAAIVADLWKRQNSLTGTHTLIHTSDLNIENLEALVSQLTKLYGSGYNAVISADVSGSSANAFRIDQTKSEYGTFSLTQGIAASILLGSFGGTGINKGVNIEELKLCVLKPQTFNHNTINAAVDDLENRAHYLYYSSAGTRSRRYWFYTKPNMNILINQATNEIKQQTIDAEIRERLEKAARTVQSFNVLAAPSPDIPEQKNPTFIILGPQHAANPEQIDSKLKPLLEKLAAKKGNSERIYRNTILFLVCSEIGLSKLNSHLREHLACVIIKNEYQSQLEPDQVQDLKKRIDETSKQVDSSLAAAYSIIAKYTSKQGIAMLVVRQFADRLDLQINTHIYSLLINEEWLLEGIGMNTLRNNNLIPIPENPVRARDVYEAFIRYDDKPMITGIQAVQKSLLKYCIEGQFGIASGDGETFTNIYYKEPVPYFDVTDTTYWIVDKSLKEPEPPPPPPPPDPHPPQPGPYPPPPPPPPPPGLKTFKSVTISGKVDIGNYPSIFSSLIMPLKDNKVEIELKIKGTSTANHPITENSQQYKITKESATQLDLFFEEEE